MNGVRISAGRGRLTGIFAPHAITVDEARRVRFAVERAHADGTPIVFDEGWRIETHPLPSRTRIRLAQAERWLTA